MKVVILASTNFGFQTSANLTNWILEKQILKNVATEWTNLSAAGANITVPPLSVKDGSAAAAGLVGEVISSTVASGSAVSLTTGTPKTVTSVSLTAGDCDCRGEGDFTGTATTIAGLGAGINTRTNVFPVPTAVSANLLNATFVAASNNYLPLAPFRVNVTSATSEFLIALANFVGGRNFWLFTSARRPGAPLRRHNFSKGLIKCGSYRTTACSLDPHPTNDLN
jgi:hypothetical protein